MARKFIDGLSGRKCTGDSVRMVAMPFSDKLELVIQVRTRPAEGAPPPGIVELSPDSCEKITKAVDLSCFDADG